MIVKDQVHLQYDKKYDILYIDIGEPCAAYSDEIDDGIYLRINPKTEKAVGVTIFSYKSKPIEKIAKTIHLPIDWIDINRRVDNIINKYK